MMKKKIALLMMVLAAVSSAYAVENGQVSKSLMSIFSGMNSIFSGICIIVGIGLIFASFIQYRQHRVNKLLVPISKPIFFLLLGIVLVAVPLLGQSTQGGRLVSQQEY